MSFVLQKLFAVMTAGLILFSSINCVCAGGVFGKPDKPCNALQQQRDTHVAIMTVTMTLMFKQTEIQPRVNTMVLAAMMPPVCTARPLL